MRLTALRFREAWRAAFDVRCWIWPLTLVVAGWLDRDWAPAFVRWEAPAGGVLVTVSTRALLWPGAIALAALVGTVRAWSGRSKLNGAYLAICLPVLLVFGAVSFARVSYRLEVDTDRARVRTHGIYWRTVVRSDLSRVESLAVARRGVHREFPVLVRTDGSRIHVRGEGGWAFAEAVARLWQVPIVATAGGEGRP